MASLDVNNNNVASQAESSITQTAETHYVTDRSRRARPGRICSLQSDLSISRPILVVDSFLPEEVKWRKT